MPNQYASVLTYFNDAVQAAKWMNDIQWLGSMEQGSYTIVAYLSISIYN